MSRFKGTSICAAILATALGGASLGQAQQPPFATSKVEGTDNVYIFRYGGHQSMFIVTPAGVIATDPIGQGRPQAVTTYIDEIKKVTNAPIKYVIYTTITGTTSPAASRSRTWAPYSSRNATPRRVSKP